MLDLANNFFNELKIYYPDLVKKITQEEISKIAFYIKELIKWNQRTNLVGKDSATDIFHELIIDSLYLKELISYANKGLKKDLFSFLDIGAGAGIPGVPFRIVYPLGTYLMIEPRQKRMLFVNIMIKKLGLTATAILPKRVQDVKEQFDVVLSRAFCPWRDFLQLSNKLLKEKGLCIVFSNQKWKQADMLDYLFLYEFTYKIKRQKNRYLWLFEKKAPS